MKHSQRGIWANCMDEWLILSLHDLNQVVFPANMPGFSLPFRLVLCGATENCHAKYTPFKYIGAGSPAHVLQVAIAVGVPSIRIASIYQQTARFCNASSHPGCSYSFHDDPFIRDFRPVPQGISGKQIDVFSSRLCPFIAGTRDFRQWLLNRPLLGVSLLIPRRPDLWPPSASAPAYIHRDPDVALRWGAFGRMVEFPLAQFAWYTRGLGSGWFCTRLWSATNASTDRSN